jgi:hypothetical protein
MELYIHEFFVNFDNKVFDGDKHYSPCLDITYAKEINGQTYFWRQQEIIGSLQKEQFVSLSRLQDFLNKSKEKAILAMKNTELKLLQKAS